MLDSYGRKIEYLRISITDRCNYRCVYCMPPEGVEKMEHCDMLTLEEIEEIARAFVRLGVKKLRLTGGEPLARKGLVDLCRRLGAIEGVEDISLTTNASLLAPVAAQLREAGVRRVNVSLDTLDAEKFKKITRVGRLSDAIEGIRAALAVGMSPVKLNTVLIGGFNDDEIPALVGLTRLYPVDVRFIELMPIGHTTEFGAEAYLPCSVVLERVPELTPAGTDGGVAKLYTLPDALGRVGLISPLSSHFCAECNRMRLTSDGKLKPCLHSRQEIPVRGLHGEELEAAIKNAILCKPQMHVELSAEHRSESARNMNQIGG
ncbi:MAG: GTP 3',8-cyclase MoaA [Oscillospiraceae bacterium]|nr:GTP 3',8-cyclase MoaA [Oscillospiraceae bacterium]